MLAVGMEALDGIDLAAVQAGALHIIVIGAVKLRENVMRMQCHTAHAERFIPDTVG